MLSALPNASADEAIDFAEDVRPLLSNYCFQCHGPDEVTREAGLRLDTPEGAYGNLGGYQAVQPHDLEQSALIERITTDDDSSRMPPVDSGLELSEGQIEILKNWVKAGGEYDQHWSFRPIQHPAVPSLAEPSNNAASSNRQIRDGEAAQVPPPTGPLDRFIDRRLHEVGFSRSQQAGRTTLIRRLYLDLLGILPSPADTKTFVKDASPGAYARLVDRVLANPHFGEKWGRHWLDQARYADTNGYTIDSSRTIWPYRDWVIDAINQDKPFDEFTIEQLAGDLLPQPTTRQLVATAFHRNTLINQEGGTDAEQFRNEATVDRVNTTGAVWLGLTVGCAQCHTHKFDPLTQRDYYRLFAFFNQAQDANSVAPIVEVASAAQQQRLDALNQQITRAQAALDEFDGQPADPQRASLAAAVKEAQDARAAVTKSIPKTMVMRDQADPRTTHLLVRGDFLRKGEEVTSGTPAFLSPRWQQEAAGNRLDLARWLVAPENPLPARVRVNRVWMRLFGRGLVETENDFGLQGTPPTHPELLDWLAAELQGNDWSIKHLVRTITTSATYRQSSAVSAEWQAADPLNKWLGRQSRIRVDAEIVRDLAQSASGLLDREIGGPSVYPPQPDGVYAFTQRRAAWPTSQGGDRHRRGMYTFFMRSAPHPMLTTFDTPAFNTTCTRRLRSNTPLQSLTMANDEAMIEAARGLAQRLLREETVDSESELTIRRRDASRIERAWRWCFARRPGSEERASLINFLTTQRRQFADAPPQAASLAGIELGDSERNEAEIVDLAATTALARVLMNLDEFITRE